MPPINEKGAALVIALMFLGILGLLGTTAVVMTTTDMKIGANYGAGTQALYDAEAGIQFAIAKMEEGLKANPPTFSLPTSTDPTDPNNSSTLTYTLPSGFSFVISDITMLGANAYSFTGTGGGPDKALAALKVTFERDPAIKFAGFGNQKLDAKSGGMTRSYDSSSSDTTKNDPGDSSFQSTHEADIGSNDWLVTHNGALIDGSGVLGEKTDGSPTTDGIHGGTTFYGTTPVNAGRIDPDPLGVNSGGEYDPTTYSASNHNLTHASPQISGNAISTNGNVTLTGQPGCSNFYLTSVELKNGATLTIDTSAGEVNMFLTGAFDAKNGSSIVLAPDPLDTAQFSIFSNSTSKIDFKNSSAFAGLVYAPYAPVDVKNSADVYGAIWGANVDIKNSGTLYYDSALSNKYVSNNLSLTTWEDLSH